MKNKNYYILAAFSSLLQIISFILVFILVASNSGLDNFFKNNPYIASLFTIFGFILVLFYIIGFMVFAREKKEKYLIYILIFMIIISLLSLILVIFEDISGAKIIGIILILDVLLKIIYYLSDMIFSIYLMSLSRLNRLLKYLGILNLLYIIFNISFDLASNTSPSKLLSSTLPLIWSHLIIAYLGISFYGSIIVTILLGILEIIFFLRLAKDKKNKKHR